MSFYGPASAKPQPKDVARYLGFIREAVGRKSVEQALPIVASLFHAVAHYALHAFGHRETLALIADVKATVEDTDVGGRVTPF